MAPAEQVALPALGGERHSSISGRAVSSLIESYRYSFSDEKDLQDGIEGVLAANGISYEREYHLVARDIPDFLVLGGICVEVKVDGSLAAVTRQLHRYAQHEKVREIVLVTSRQRLANLPATLNEKPIHVARLFGGFV